MHIPMSQEYKRSPAFSKPFYGVPSRSHPPIPARILLQPSEIAGIQRPHLLRFVLCSSGPLSDFTSLENRRSSEGSTSVRLLSYHHYSQRHDFFTKASEAKKLKIAEAKKSTIDDHSQRAVTTALWANFFVFSLKFGVWLLTSSHVMLAEMVHSVADFANQLMVSVALEELQMRCTHMVNIRRDLFGPRYLPLAFFALARCYNRPWISKLVDFSGDRLQSLLVPQTNIQDAALVIGGSFLVEGASLVVAIHALLGKVFF
ncbi:hypothetical protein Sjap_018977 [Stephania japonica]|uniref:Cation efflux protein transmembrane domain-containing protein n=1 Tax=Stephania japonica TaxID=461633 RepID=A0AAP0F549_9MAGN